jgi:hypothetical protein
LWARPEDDLMWTDQNMSCLILYICNTVINCRMKLKFSSLVNISQNRMCSIRNSEQHTVELGYNVIKGTEYFVSL